MEQINDILRRLHLSEMNAMQLETADRILNTRKDVVVLSPTGTGKTLAYLLPLTILLSAQGNEHQSGSEGKQSYGNGKRPDGDGKQPLTDEASLVQAVVIVPGRELALQSCEVLKSMRTGLRGMALYGGRPTMDEHRELRKQQPHIVFATPGRLNDHIEKGNLAVDTIEWLIIDEFDKCLEMGFQNEMSRLVEMLPQIRRRLLLSATESEAIPRFVNMGNTVRVDYRNLNGDVAHRIAIYRVDSPTKDKLPTLLNLLLGFGDESTVVFLNHRDAVERTASFLREEGFTVSLFHGGLEQRQREDALYKFANGSANVLVATDLASRGLDIPDIDNIVHYHLPETSENYTHRIGRTARWDKQGSAFFLLNEAEEIPAYVEDGVSVYTLPQWDEGERPLPPRPKMVTIYIGKGKRDKLSKGDIVGFLCKKGGLKGDEIGRISVDQRYTYVAIPRTRLRQVLKNVQGEKIKGIKTIVEEVH